MFFAKLFSTVFGKRIHQASSKHRRVRPMLEGLEDRTVLSNQLRWTDTIGPFTGLWSVAANWTDTVTPTDHRVPGPADYVYFGSGGASTPCLMDVTTPGYSVDRVIMDSGYTSTLTIPAGNALDVSNHFVQWGTLVMDGTLTAGTMYNINDDVVCTSGAPAFMSTTGDFFLNATASITSLGDLRITAGNFDDGGTINVGLLNVGAGILTITGGFTQQPAALTEVFPNSVLNYLSGGIPGARPFLQGANNMHSATSINTNTELALSGGTLDSLAGANTIGAIAGNGGNVRVYNGGAFTIGLYGLTASAVTLGGSLTVGAPDPDSSSTAGTLNINVASVLALAAPATATFVVKSQGVINMYGGGATIALGGVGTVNLGGTLNSLASLNFIDGNVSNSGTIQFGGALNTLTIVVGYTQTSGGTLAARLDNGAANNDALAVGGTATLAGTLTLTAVAPLTAAQAWTVVGAGTIVGDFTSVNFPPDGNPAWAELAGVVTN